MSEFKIEKIKELRRAGRISQKELGEMLGVSDRAVSKWETGLAKPTAENMMRIARIFDVPLEYFLKEEKISLHEHRSVGMESIRELYKIGRGPSSSHTIGPERACVAFKERNPDADAFSVILYGSLAKTGRGHGTDTVIKKTLAPMPCKVEFNCHKVDIPHPNTLELFAYRDGKEIDRAEVMSVGGGSIVFDNAEIEKPPRIYSESKFTDIAEYCKEKHIRIYEYAIEKEGEGFVEYMKGIWDAMKASINAGLDDEGILPGGLEVHKKARSLFNSQHIDESAETRENRMVCSYAFAVSEQNASGEKIVTAPTCGASGVLPAVLYYQQKKRGIDDSRIINALITAGVIGNLIKTNASISGAECGCQAEVGSACAMASAALAELFELNIDKIEYAAEIAIEHHLGLTCDPICGLVQIPCIERNAVAAMRAINAVNLANFLWDTRKISFDRVVLTMKETGRDLHSSYKETSEAGLAKIQL
ncbi:MAG: L-serine ammonia-lyase, iron-sulfur-dependent, subunit alpha [Clostridia bacterium]|nr:L-serine ammonia-lyase, iron-sulfur-dependent, subunit alpha [Clostridia bacterium]